MFEIIALLGFSIFELIVAIVFIFAGLVGIALDRNNMPSVKWIVLVGGFFILAGITWNNWSFRGIGETLLTAEFWRGVGLYVIVGVLYSVIEFVVGIKRSANNYKRVWNSTAKFETTQGRVREVTRSLAGWKNEDPFVEVSSDFSDSKISVSINKAILHSYVWAWTFWWPFYALNMIFGRLLTRIFNLITEFFANVGEIIVRKAFRPIFGDLMK